MRGCAGVHSTKNEVSFLSLAAGRWKPSIVRRLLDMGLDLNIRANLNETSLHSAVRESNDEPRILNAGTATVEELIDANVDLDAVQEDSDQGGIALQIAQRRIMMPEIFTEEKDVYLESYPCSKTLVLRTLMRKYPR